MDFTQLSDLCDRIKSMERRLDALEKKPKAKAQTESNRTLWATFCIAHTGRYGFEPVRNAKVNKNISELNKRVGLDTACKLVEYYLKQNDAYYLRRYHNISVLLADCESMVTRMKTGMVITGRQANQIELVSTNLNQSEIFMRGKSK